MRNKRKILAVILTAVMALAMSMTAFAAGWQQNTTGWWYQEDNGTWPANTWKWIDGNGDGVAECYYFDGNGYMLANTTTPDGYIVNSSGAWTENGVVKTQATGQSQPQNQTSTSTNVSTSNSGLTSQQIVDYLCNDKINGAVNLTIDNSKAAVSSGATNIKHILPNFKDGWVWFTYNRYASHEYFVCALAFDENGYLLVNTTTPDGYHTNEYGMLIINGQPVVHSARCKVFPYSTDLYDVNGNLVTDKNNADLSKIDVLHTEMGIGNFLIRIPFGSLVYSHCQYQAPDGTWPHGNGFGNCVDAQKAMYERARD